MYGSTHFQVYEHNLRRILLLDWLRDEQLRRRISAVGSKAAQMSSGAVERPYWLAEAERTAGAAG
jgi:hypothetical protein